MNLDEDLPSSVDDFPAGWLAVSEWQALVKHHEDEVWVWEHMARHEVVEGNKKKAKDYRLVAEFHRKRARVFKGYVAQEEAAQTKFNSDRQKEIEERKASGR